MTVAQLAHIVDLRETLLEEFICLHKIASDLLDVDGKIEKGLTREKGCILDTLIQRWTWRLC